MTTTQNLTALHDRALTLTDEIATRTQELEEIKAAIRDQATLGEHAAGTGHVILSVNRRFNPEAFTADFPASTRPDLYKLVPHAPAVKAALPPNKYEGYMVEVGLPRVSFR